MSLPTLPTGPVHIVLPPGIVGTPISTTIKICPTGPSGTLYNENSPTGPGSGHETQPPNQPPGTTQGPTLPGPVIVPSGPSLTGPGPVYRELYRETHISKNIQHLVIEDPSPTDPYEVNFIPTVVNFESTKPNLLQINQTDTTDIKFTPTTINYESTDLDTLTIDQTDPTHILFTAQGGGVDIFGNTRTLWVVANNLATDAMGSAIINGVTVYPHDDITYTTDGTFTFTRGGYYLYTITGKVPAPGSSGNFAVINFNPDSASLNGGRPSRMSNANLITPSSFETTANVTNMTGIFTGDITTFKPTIQTSWAATWTTVNVIIGTIYGPETAGTGGGGAIEWDLNPIYVRQSPYNFNPASSTGNVWSFAGAPYGINGETPAHTFTDTLYVGDTLTPYWYPNGQIYMSFRVAPAPNLTADDFTITVEAWDSVMPTDIFVKPLIYNAGIGNFAQGFLVWFPFINGNYIGTSFRLNVSITGIVDDHKIYFKYSPVNENGCADDMAINFRLAIGDNQIGYGYYQDYYNTQYTNFATPFPRFPGLPDRYDTLHLTLVQGTLWDDPSNIVFEYTGNATIWTGYVFVDFQLGDLFYVTNADILATYGLSPPLITYVPPTDITTYNHPYPWFETPVGHWAFSYENIGSGANGYVINNDYYVDISWLGLSTNPPAYPPWYQGDNRWPIAWEIAIKWRGTVVSTFMYGHAGY